MYCEGEACSQKEGLTRVMAFSANGWTFGHFTANRSFDTVNFSYNLWLTFVYLYAKRLYFPSLRLTFNPIEAALEGIAPPSSSKHFRTIMTLHVF